MDKFFQVKLDILNDNNNNNLKNNKVTINKLLNILDIKLFDDAA